MVEQWIENPFVSGSIPLLDTIMNNSKIKLLISLKNSAISKKESIKILHNSSDLELIKVLYKEGFIQSFNFDSKNENSKSFINIQLRYYDFMNSLENLKLSSTPSLTKYLKLKNLYNLNDKKVVFFLSTVEGLKTSIECKKSSIGGKLLFLC